jgi:hypothetical protein
MSAKRLDNLLKPNKDGGLGEVVRRARAMGELATALGRVLPADLADGIVAANLRDGGELVIICRSSAWASRLRFEHDRILEAARSTGAEASSLSIKVSQQV